MTQVSCFSQMGPKQTKSLRSGSFFVSNLTCKCLCRLATIEPCSRQFSLDRLKLQIKVEQLAKGNTLLWVPSHRDIFGNEKADAPILEQPSKVPPVKEASATIVWQIRNVFITLLVSISYGIPASGNTHTTEYTTSLARYDSDCDYYQNVQIGQTYYVYSPNYPDAYAANINCRWVAVAPQNYRINLDCQVNIPVSENCQNDRLEVSRSGQPDLSDAQRYCGSGSFVSESQANQLVIALLIPFYSSGGNFLCSLSAVRTTQPGFTEQCVCGVKKKTRIVGGQETGINEYPMMAALVDSTTREVYCGATIIARNYAVSAAHCLTNRDIEVLGLLVGDHNYTSSLDTTYAAVYRLSNIIIHPQYESNTDYNDIAMVRTTNPMTFNEGVSAVCLPFRSGIMQSSFANESVEALGWGTTSFGGPLSTALQEVRLNVISNAKCRPTYPNLSSSQLCTFARDKDTCQSDSGGPLLYTNPNNRLLYLVAIVSYGNGCATLSPSVNTRVTSYLTWIMMNSPGVIYCLK